MGWLLAQVWVLCVIAFLAGAAVTWLVFVRPLHGAAHRAPTRNGWTPLPAWASDPASPAPPPEEPSSPPPAPAVDPALAALGGSSPDPNSPDPRSSGPGLTATGALDLLGVRKVGPNIPAQARPGNADEDRRRPPAGP